MTQVRQNFHQESEDAINKQINLELTASYVYSAMACHFNRDDVALQGFYKYFKESAEDERKHANKLMEYLNKRGGRIVLRDIKAPAKQSWDSPLEALTEVLALEKNVNQSLLKLHSTASDHKDANLCDYLESEFLQEQVDDIKEIADHITNLKRVGEGLGVFVFDRELEQKE